MYKVFRWMKEIGRFETFLTAWMYLYGDMKRNIPQTKQELTTVWIETPDGVPIFFDTAKELAYQRGWKPD